MIYPKPIHIISASRSPIGRFGGSLKSLAPVDLALQVADSICDEETKKKISEVVLGQVFQIGHGMNVARQLVVKGGFPQTTPAQTVNMVCGSGLKAVTTAADALSLGAENSILAGGVESMSYAPHYTHDIRADKECADPKYLDCLFADGLTDPLLQISMGETAERIADKYSITREEQDEFALLSQQRVAENRERFQREITPITTPDGELFSTDEHPRPDSSLEKLASLNPVFRRENGTVTAANASGINDGAALLLLSANAETSGRARIVGTTSVGCDPALMGLGPVYAIRRLLDETGWKLDEVGAWEINEAFAVQTLACARDLDLDLEKLNRRGGAVALGHPVGASGARILVTLLHIMEDLDLKKGIASLCCGGGMGVAVAIER